MNNFNFYKVFFSALKIIQETEQDKDLRTKQSLKLMEAITILANENKKELISILFTGEKPTGSQNSRYNQMAQVQKEGTTIEQRKQYLALLSQLLIQEDTGLQIQVVEVFKVIFESMKNSEIDEKIVNLLMNDFFSHCFEHYQKMEINNQFINFVIQFLDLFYLAYKLSPPKFRIHVQKNQLIIKLFQRSDCRAKAIHLALIKLVRSLIVCDNTLINHLISSKIIDKIWEIYKNHERRSNLVNSTFQDMMHYLLVQNYHQTPKLFKYIMNKFGDELKARQNKILCFKKIVDVYGTQKDWINQDRNEQLEFQNAEYLQQPHRIMESIEEEKYFDSDDTQTVEAASPQLDSKQQQEKDKVTMMKRKSFNEKNMKSLSNDDDDDLDMFQLGNTMNFSGQNNNNGQNNQGDLISSSSSSSSLSSNSNLNNYKGESPVLSLSDAEQSQDKQNKIEFIKFNLFGIDYETNKDHTDIVQVFTEVEEKSFDNNNDTVTKKENEQKDEKYNESKLNNTSDSKINAKRKFEQLDYDSHKPTHSEEYLNGESVKKDSNGSDTGILNQTDSNHEQINQSDTSYGKDFNNVHKNGEVEEEQPQQNIVKGHGEEVVQKKIKVD